MARPGPGPAAHMRLFRAGRPLKRWRYVAIFNEELMACAALVQIGPARQSFWALLQRAERELHERTHLLPRRSALRLARGTSRNEDGVDYEPGRLLLRDDGVVLDLSLEEDSGFEARCPNGESYVWTRKQAGIRASGTLALGGGAPQEIDALAVIDDTAGYHARQTEWWWSAGVGRSPEGAAVAWNLVSGVNDPPTGSERAVWLDGEPREAPPVVFTDDLKRIACEDGTRLRFHAEAERARSENLLIVKSDYRAPFGSFSGTLPGGIALAHGLGVVEHHRALW